MLQPSVASFYKKNEKKPKVAESAAHKATMAQRKKGIDDYVWRMHKLNIDTKKRNTDAVA